MTEKLITTGIIARDPRRRIFRGKKSGIGFDLPANYRPETYRIVGPAQSDQRRVLVEGSNGLIFDISPEKAAALIG